MAESPDPLDPLVERMLAGDEAALRLVYRDAQPRLIRYLTVLVGPDAAEDVASETWAQAFRDLDRFTGDADHFRGWLTSIGRHRALDHLRQRQRRPRADMELTDVPDRPADNDVAVIVAATLETEAVLAMVSALPTDQAEAILLRVVWGFDAPAAARILGKRPGAVRSATLRGLRALARTLPNDESKNFATTRNSSISADAEGT